MDISKIIPALMCFEIDQNKTLYIIVMMDFQIHFKKNDHKVVRWKRNSQKIELRDKFIFVQNNLKLIQIRGFQNFTENAYYENSVHVSFKHKFF